MKFLTSIWNLIRGADEKFANATKNNVRDTKFKIEDAKKKVADFESSISAHIAARLELERNSREAQAQVKKWDNIAKRAGSDQDEATARIAITKKHSFKSSVKGYELSIQKNKALSDKFIKQRDTLKGQIDSAKHGLTGLAAREKSANLNIQMEKASSNLQKSDLDLGLGDFEDEVAAKENQAQAWEELNHDEDGDIEDKYGANGSDDVEDELTKLMGKTNKG